MPVPEEGYLERPQLACLQGQRLRDLLAAVVPNNRFYAAKFAAAKVDVQAIRGVEDLPRLPFTTKAELLADQEAHPPYGSNLTFALGEYGRLCQTSGTKGRPLRWLDTAQNWVWMLGCWEQIFRFGGVRRDDRLLFAFTFGPFLGFWTAFEAAQRLGCLCLPAGGMTSQARLRYLMDNRATVLLCTPTYALRLAEVAQEQGLHPDSIRILLVAGEPGGSIPATRWRIESAWGARVIDNSGMTETGPVAVECQQAPGGLHILEGDHLAEVLDAAGNPASEGELVLTNLGRVGSPVIRYRTGDRVRIDPKPCPCGRTFVRLDGGILGRTDDMVHLRGNNFYPSALEAVIRRFPEVAEFRVEVDETGTLAALRVEVEAPDNNGLSERVAAAIREEFLFGAEVRVAAPGSLPRFEMKAQRFVRRQVAGEPGA